MQRFFHCIQLLHQALFPYAHIQTHVEVHLTLALVHTHRHIHMMHACRHVGAHGIAHGHHLLTVAIVAVEHNDMNSFGGSRVH